MSDELTRVKEPVLESTESVDEGVVDRILENAGERPKRHKQHPEHIRVKAANLLALDQMTGAKIADECGIAIQTLKNWKNDPEFQELVNEHRLILDQEMRRLRIAKVRERLKVLDKLLTKQLEIVDSRARAYGGTGLDDTSIEVTVDLDRQPGDPHALAPFEPAELGAPGAETGLLVRDVKMMGKNDYKVTWTLDVALLKSILEYQEAAAREMGQRTDRSETEQRTTTFRVVGVDVDSI